MVKFLKTTRGCNEHCEFDQQPHKCHKFPVEGLLPEADKIVGEEIIWSKKKKLTAASSLLSASRRFLTILMCILLAWIVTCKGPFINYVSRLGEGAGCQ